MTARRVKTADGDPALRQVTEALYDAALRPELVPDALRGVGDLTGGHNVSYAIFGPGVTPSVVVSRGCSEPDPQLMDPAWTNPWTQTSLRHPPGTILLTDEFYPLEKLRRTDFYHHILRGILDIEHGLGFNFEDHGTIVSVVSHRSRRQGPFSREAVARFRVLAPHLERSAQVQLRISRATAGARAALEALHQLQLGVVITDEAGRVRFASRNADLEADGPLGVRRGHLVAATAAQTRELHRLIARAARTGAGQGVHPGGVMRVAQAVGDAALEVMVAPLPIKTPLPWPSAPAALVLFRPARHPLGLERRLQQLYGLTAAEARVTRAILQGRGTAPAEALGMSRNTVRTHLYRVLDKTGTRRQAELVRLLLSGPVLLVDDDVGDAPGDGE